MTPELKAVFEKILPLQAASLPPAIRDLLLAPPVKSLDVVVSGDAFALESPGLVQGPSPQAFVPKLGIKSWRDGGSLNVIYDGVPLAAALQKILARPSKAQRILSQAWLLSGQPLQVDLSPYIDFTDISEARFLAGPRAVRAVSVCLRGASAARIGALMPRLHSAARELVGHLPPRSHLFDLACLHDGKLRVVEINPALTPQDLKVLAALG